MNCVSPSELFQWLEDIPQNQNFRMNRIMIAINAGVASVGPQNDAPTSELGECATRQVNERGY